MNRVLLRLGLLLVPLSLALGAPAGAQPAQPTEQPSEPSAQPQPQRARVVRVAGDSRVATAVAASREAFPDGADTVVIAAARRFPDALAAVPLAASEQAPLLLVEERAQGAVLAEIGRLGATRALLMAASGAVPVVVALELERAGLAVERVAGDGRFHTAARIAGLLGPGPEGEVLVASGATFADALPAGPLAARVGMPVLLTAPDALSPDAEDSLERLRVARTLLVGGQAVVSAAVEDTLPRARRVAGPDRYATSVAIAEELRARDGSLRTVGVATGRDFADALAAGPVLARAGGPLLLVDGQDAAQAEAVYAYLSAHRDDIERVLVFGGTAAVSDAVLARVEEALG